MFKRKGEVTQGQRYRKTDRSGFVFVVVGLKTDAQGAVHAHLQRQDEPSSHRTLAECVLLNSDEYELLS